MAAYDIQKHFKSLRVDTGRKKARDPFATGFEDEIDEKRRRQKAATKEEKPATAAAPAVATTGPNSATNGRKRANSIRDEEDEFLDPRPQNAADRRNSPAPAHLAASPVSDGAAKRSSIDKQQTAKPSLAAKKQAGGILAYLDDSDDEEALAPPTRRHDRRPSPAPRTNSEAEATGRRSSTPRGEKENSQNRTAVPRHTVASAFAGTKYLQDSDSDEEAVTSRSNSVDQDEEEDEALDALDPFFNPGRRRSVKRADKPKTPKVQNGGGVSWRAFSASRAEQRNAELEALQATLKKRGKSISFGTHAVTDDGQRIPIIATGLGNIKGAPKPAKRGRSPPRREQDVEPTADEAADRGDVERYDPAEFKTNPFTGMLTRARSFILLPCIIKQASNYQPAGQPVRRSNSNSDNGPPPKACDAQQPGGAGDKLPHIRIDDISAQRDL